MSPLRGHEEPADAGPQSKYRSTRSPRCSYTAPHLAASSVTETPSRLADPNAARGFPGAPGFRSFIRKPVREGFAEATDPERKSRSANRRGPAAANPPPGGRRCRSKMPRFIVTRFDEALVMDQTSLLRLERIEIDGLFGLYHHCIDLNLKDRVTLLHGPNGVGKTTTLGMVDALLRGNMGYFGRLPFRRFLLRFEDETELELIADEFGETHRRAELALQRPDGQRELDVVSLVAHAEIHRCQQGITLRVAPTRMVGLMCVMESSFGIGTIRAAIRRIGPRPRANSALAGRILA